MHTDSYSQPAAPAARAGAFSLSCVVPVHNGAVLLDRFLRELAITAKALTPTFELVVVDDGSADGSVERAAALAHELPITLVQLSRHFGKEAALTAGLEQARGDIVLLIDADFQHPLALVAAMVAQWRAGYDMVFGVRTDRPRDTALRRVGAHVFHRLLAQSPAVRIAPDTGDFRLLDRRVVDALLRLPERNRYMNGLYAWVGFRSTGLPYAAPQPPAGASVPGLRALRRRAVTGITAFSNVPLQVAGATGVVVALGAFAWSGYILFERLFLKQPIDGFATLAIAIMLFSGVQLISIGVLGEYLGRVYDEVKRRPTYLLGRVDDHSPLRQRASRSKSGLRV